MRRPLVLLALLAACKPDLQSPTPSVSSLDPALVCNEQLTTTVTLTGAAITPVPEDDLNASLLVIPDLSLTHASTIDGQSGTGDTVDLDETAAAPDNVTWQAQTTMSFDVTPGRLAAGVYDLGLVQADGQSTSLPAGLIAVDPPTLQTVVPELFCGEQHETVLVLTGTGFLTVGDALPVVHIGDHDFSPDSTSDCTALAGPVEGAFCTGLSVTVPAEAVPTGVFAVSVTNPPPADCASTEAVEVEIVPAPTLSAAVPQIFCGEQHDTTLTLTGTGFIEVAGALPVVSLGDEDFMADSMLDCTDLAGPAGGQSCTGLSVTVPADALVAGVYAVTVTNPAPATCATLEEVAVEIVPPPTLTSVGPAIFCGAQNDTTVTLTGTGFVDLNGAMPVISIGDQDFAPDSEAGCTDLLGPAGGKSCTELTVTVGEEQFAAGVYDVYVTNPVPADCETEDDVRLEIVPPPTITNLVPEAVCLGSGDVPVAIEGANFVTLGADEPVVTFEGKALPIDDLAGCVDLVGPVPGQSCSEINVTVPVAAYGRGTYDVVVTNPDPATCDSDPAGTFIIAAPPTITSVAPNKVCDSGGSFTVRGTGFTPTAVVEVDGKTATSATYVDDTTLLVEVGGGLSSGPADVAVTTAAGCAATKTAAINVVPAPLVFYIDPPVAYNGVSVDATLYVTGVTGKITDVSIVDSKGVATTLVFDASDPTQIHATLPAGLPDDDYDVDIVQDGTCPAFLEAGLHVESTATIAVKDVDPNFAWAGGYTPVRIGAIDPPPAGMVQFQDLPRVYLDPTTDPDALAEPIESLSFIDKTALDAVVGPGLAPDKYDVIVVNPDGSVGILRNGLTVTVNPPPRVDTLSPPSISNSGTPSITVRGGDFRTPTVRFDCRVPGTSTTTTATATGSAVGATSFTVTVPVATLATGVCLLTVTNGDGTSVTYSSLSITSPSQNLYPFATSSSTMATARRAPAAIAGRATTSARYLYAIGGDGGALASAKDTIEVSGVNKLGALDGFFTLTNKLPEARTLAGVARVGRFVYLVGGNDGETTIDPGPQTTVWRAQVLDPLAAPRITDLSVSYGTGTQMGVGTWAWRVAALFPAGYTSNPSGVSLASDPIVAHLPDIPDKFKVEINWTAVPGASGYRIYRSPAPNSASNALVKLVDVGAVTSFVDSGAPTASAEKPLPKGALGMWATMPPMPFARQSPCVGTGVDPTNPLKTYIYAIGGLDAAGLLHDEVGYLDITTNPDGSQTPGTWKTATGRLSTKVFECGAWTVDPTFHTVVGTDTWIYAGGGRTNAGSTVTTGVMAAGKVLAGGDLGTWTTTLNTMNPTRAGFGLVSASDFLYMLGGQAAAPSAGGKSTRIDGPPAIGNFNAGFSLVTPRYLMGSAQESGVIFIVGGQTSSAAASADVEFANF